MKVLFVTGLYPNEYVEDLRVRANSVIQNAPNVFQWSVVDGLVNNKVDFEVVSLPFIPAYPHGFSSFYTPYGCIKYNGTQIGYMIRYCDLIVYKTRSMRINLQRYIKQWIARNSDKDGDLVILTYTPYTPFIKAAVNATKHLSNVTIASIVTDLVDDMMNFESNRKFLKRIQCFIEARQIKRLYRYIDKYILLSKHMIEKIPFAEGRNIVIEGISVEKPYPTKHGFSEIKTILYTGTLQHFAGVANLLEAFSKMKNDACQLIICGDGPLAPMVRYYAEKDKRIIYKGLVSNDEALRLQRIATVLINPRKPDLKITKYSFPSKTMEYLSSGTPMIGYKLEGIPDEYYDYYYAINDVTEEALLMTLNNVLTLDQSILRQKALDAYEFIMNKKNSTAQVKKIIDFLTH